VFALPDCVVLRSSSEMRAIVIACAGGKLAAANQGGVSNAAYCGRSLVLLSEEGGDPMTSMFQRTLFVTGAMLALGACMKNPSPANNQATTETNAATTASSDPTASAQSAAPASISGGASIVQASADGTMTELRKGTNGWTCMPDAPATPGPDPMCFDANAGKWVDAWVHHKPPPEGVVGVMYMLEGGTD